jgi:hypothetical protein
MCVQIVNAQILPSHEDFPESLIYSAPFPESDFHHLNRDILWKTAQPLNANQPVNSEAIIIEGELSGVHAFDFQIRRNPARIVINPTVNFERDETVHVSCNNCFNDTNGNPFGQFTYSFHTTGNQAAKASVKAPKPALNVEKLMPPQFEILVNENPGPGNYFIHPHTTPSNSWVMILDSVCNVLYEEILVGMGTNFDFQRSGYPSYMDRYNNWWVVLDSAMAPTETISHQGDGQTDDHEFLMLENGNFVVAANDAQTIDMSVIVEGGSTEANVTGYIIQEMDDDQLLFTEWRSWDHFEITDYDSNLTLEAIDYVHGNAFDIDYDGNFLLSSRSLNEITKINRITTETIWRFGGTQNQFEISDQGFGGFSMQHDISALDNGNYMLFDNGNNHNPQRSRAVEYFIDEDLMQASRVWQFVHPDQLFAPSQGNAQRLPNGNTVLGYGTYNQLGGGRVTEVNAAGEIVFEFKMEPGHTTYRARKYDFATSTDTVVVIVPGCTDDTAVNFDPEANEDNGTCLHDLDEDGFYDEVDDCDDTNEDINPDGVEIPNDGIDQDCNGEDLVVGVAEESSFSFSIYPNPTDQFLSVSSSTPSLANYYVFDIEGRLLDSGKISIPHTFNFHDYSSGKYLLQLEINGRNYTNDFVIQHH